MSGDERNESLGAEMISPVLQEKTEGSGVSGNRYSRSVKKELGLVELGPLLSQAGISLYQLKLPLEPLPSFAHLSKAWICTLP